MIRAGKTHNLESEYATSHQTSAQYNTYHSIEVICYVTWPVYGHGRGHCFQSTNGASHN